MPKGAHYKQDAGAEAGQGASQDGRRRHRASRVIANLLLLAGVALLVAAGVIWFQNDQRYQQNEENNAKLAVYAKLSEGAGGPPEVDWAALEAVNPDVVGWVYIPNTVVNYPVYQGSDNEYYLDHSAYGGFSYGGQIFMDHLNTAPGMVDEQTIIYGHHQRNGSMFKTVADMANQATFDGVDTVWYCTEQENFELEPLMLYKTVGTDETVRQFAFPTTDDFHSYLTGKLGSASAARADAAGLIASTEHVMTLSTCQYDEEDGRSILVCVPKSEVSGPGPGVSS
ncbi:class B sortase [Atopobiaceae bacterium HCP3S3_F7]